MAVAADNLHHSLFAELTEVILRFGYAVGVNYDSLVVRQLPFITAARLTGTGNWKIIFRHVLPNVIPGIVTFSLLGIGIVVILEGAVDFLGLGIQIPQPSWGAMIAKGQNVLTAEPQYVLIPSIVLLIFVMSLNLLGDALRERWGVR